MAMDLENEIRLAFIHEDFLSSDGIDQGINMHACTD